MSDRSKCARARVMRSTSSWHTPCETPDGSALWIKANSLILVLHDAREDDGSGYLCAMLIGGLIVNVPAFDLHWFGDVA